MGQVRGNVQDFPGAHGDLEALVLAELETQGSFEDVCELLVFMRLLRDHTAFLQVDVREHHSLAGDEAPVEFVGDFLLRHVLPSIVSCDLIVGHVVWVEVAGIYGVQAKRAPTGEPV